jgi:hypothetical protein
LDVEAAGGGVALDDVEVGGLFHGFGLVAVVGPGFGDGGAVSADLAEEWGAGGWFAVTERKPRRLRGLPGPGAMSLWTIAKGTEPKPHSTVAKCLYGQVVSVTPTDR